jgi:hypothetical protein
MATGEIMNRVGCLLAFLTLVVWVMTADQLSKKDNATSEPVLFWTMSGGIAGFCEELSVWPDGKVQASTCKFGGRNKAGKLSKEGAERLRRWIDSFGAISIGGRDPGVTDSLALTLKLRGRGKARPSESEKQQMLEWAQQVHNANRP